jgi:two-component sensor histidine kinase
VGEDRQMTDDSPPFREVADALGLGLAFQLRVPPNGDGRTFDYIGPSCEAMTGVRPEDARADAARLYGLILPEDREALAAREAEALAGMKAFDMEVRMRGPGGEIRRRRIVSTPRALPDGSTAWDGLIMDVIAAREAAAELQAQRQRLEAAVDATGLGLWDWDIGSGELVWSERNRQLFNVPADEPIDIVRYRELLHPEDREALTAVYRAARDQPAGGDFLAEHRITSEPGGKPRWLQVRGRVIKAEGRPVRVVGATLDISDRKASEERRTLLMGELAHRAKNGILVMMAIVAQTARGASSVKDFEETLLARLKAMADNQDLVTASGGRPVPLSDVVAKTLTPFDASRFEIDGTLGEVTIDGQVAVALGLLLHELSTNAMKYGALSAPTGRVRIDRAELAPGQVALKWAERGGPEVKPASRKGFGSRLLDVSLRPQGGKVEALFDRAGFQANIHFPAAPERRAR